MRRRATLGRRALLTLLVGTPAAAQPEAPWPSRPIRLIVPYIPGSAPDVIARLLAERLGTALGQPVAVENRGGAGGNIGNELASRAAPDGYRLVLGTNAMLVLPQLHSRPVGYDPLRDFAPVSLAIAMPHVLMVPPQAGLSDAAALIAALKARPGQPYASGGNGSGAHLAAELFKARAGVEATHVPFRGAPDIVNAAMAGQVAFGFPTLGTATELIRAGRLRALAVTSAARNPAVPEVPPLAETLPGFDLVSWFGLLAPAGTPAEAVRRVDEAVRTALADPGFRARATADGSLAVGLDAARFGAFLAEDYRRWGEAVRLSGAQVD